ncbi:MAG: hypothetical protein JJU23_08400 [Cyclobacteriaceae bacterium]|nr:hypothetical protein [Cyclobacteriaceae bacterium]
MPLSLFAQWGQSHEDEVLTSDTWEILSKVKYKLSYDEYGEVYKPIFGDEIKKLEGKRITLPGYIIPFDGMFKPNHIIISSLPIAACFFCGTGGPESVAEVFLSKDIKYTESPVKISGILELNSDDYEKMMYIIKDARFEGKAF